MNSIIRGAALLAFVPLCMRLSAVEYWGTDSVFVDFYSIDSAGVTAHAASTFTSQDSLENKYDYPFLASGFTDNDTVFWVYYYNAKTYIDTEKYSRQSPYIYILSFKSKSDTSTLKAQNSIMVFKRVGYSFQSGSIGESMIKTIHPDSTLHDSAYVNSVVSSQGFKKLTRTQITYYFSPRQSSVRPSQGTAAAFAVSFPLRWEIKHGTLMLHLGDWNNLVQSPTVSLFDAQGKMVLPAKQSSGSGAVVSIPLFELSRGIYLASVRDRGHIGNAKIVVK